MSFFNWRSIMKCVTKVLLVFSFVVGQLSFAQTGEYAILIESNLNNAKNERIKLDIDKAEKKEILEEWHKYVDMALFNLKKAEFEQELKKGTCSRENLEPRYLKALNEERAKGVKSKLSYETIHNGAKFLGRFEFPDLSDKNLMQLRAEKLDDDIRAILPALRSYSIDNYIGDGLKVTKGYKIKSCIFFLHQILYGEAWIEHLSKMD